MMYLKQFPDICREMGFDVEEKAKTISARTAKIAPPPPQDGVNGWAITGIL